LSDQAKAFCFININVSSGIKQLSEYALVAGNDYLLQKLLACCDRIYGPNAAARKTNAPLAGQRGLRTYWLVLRTAPC